MTQPGLTIQRLDNVCRVAEAVSDLPLVRQQDDFLRYDLPAHLEEAMPEMHQRLGISTDDVIIVRKLNVRLRLRIRDLKKSDLTSAWAEALIRALAFELEAMGTKRAQENIAWFPDLQTAETSFLIYFASKGVAPWWSPALSPEKGPISPIQVALGWLQKWPWKFANLMLAVADSSDAADLTLFTVQDIEQLWDIYNSVRFERLNHVKPGMGKKWVPLAYTEHSDFSGVRVSTPPKWMASLGATNNKQVCFFYYLYLTQMNPNLYLNAIDDVQSFWPSAPPLPNAPNERDQQMPVAEKKLPSVDHERKSMIRQSQHDSASITANPTNMQHQRVQDFDATRKQGQRLKESPASTAQISTDGSTTEMSLSAEPLLKTGCGGLLFLLNALTRVLSKDQMHHVVINQRLLQLGGDIFRKLFSRLNDDASQNAYQRELPLLRIFSGMDEVPEVLSDYWARSHPDGLLQKLIDCLPEDIAPCPNGFEIIYGDSYQAIGDDPGIARLAKLVLRLGDLQLSNTHADLYFPQRTIDLAIRRAGLDINPGWIPFLGRIIKFYYV
ncbi:hypothetical protein D3OALGA1CA_4394 [Olavius algarvensis associated proteobacterium Delta 3]|nr:hypothetical protein D3OALGA1CA_4394 [Olavius algarvensis associated proteobacterium Delta 3]CAB5162331.1 hypothetical protein D3OALGB2SA_5504 [Olavius algarvensis associated proteobacterium Delta 3]